LAVTPGWVKKEFAPDAHELALPTIAKEIIVNDTMTFDLTETKKPLASENVSTDWGRARCVFFRFACAYLLLYIVPFPLNYIPTPDKYPVFERIIQQYQDLWNRLVTWVGDYGFHVTITVRPNGSGDTTWNYVQVLCFAVLAALAAVVWTLVDWKRRNYSRLHQRLRVYVRFYLAATMVLYGSVKVIKSQFPDPSLDRLVQPFGDASPMGLLWTFMGASESYNIFTGAGEMLGGLLLTTRRTTLFGAIVCIGVLSNVVMLNFSYDVPVKLFSMHLLAMAMFLAVPDMGRLANLFLFNRRAEPAPIKPWLVGRRTQAAIIVLRTVLVLAFVGNLLYVAQERRKQFGDLSSRSPLRGIWSVETIAINGEVKPPIVTDTARWRRVIFDFPGMMAIQLMSDNRQRYLLKLDEQSKTLTLTKRDDPNWSSTLKYQETETGAVLVLGGQMDGQAIYATLRRADESSFLLVSRGFHWINEYPFNR
jgi:hypothetical protein